MDQLALPMRAISLWQPWASLVAAGVKIHETRHWSTTYRGPIAIHAAKTIDRVGAPAQLCAAVLGRDWWADCPAGAVVAVANLTGCHRAEDARRTATPTDISAGNFEIGRFAWKLDNIRPLIEPISLAGRQGLFIWTPPEGYAANLGEPLDHHDICRRRGLLARCVA